MIARCKYGYASTPNTEAMTSRQAAKFLGMGKSAINDHRSGKCSCQPRPEQVALASGRLELTSEGGSFSGIETTEPIRGDWTAVFERFNLDPAEFVIADDTVKMSSWQSSKRTDDGDRDIVWLYSYSARFTRKSVESRLDLPALYAAAKSASPKSMPPYQERATVIVWADPQIGKTGSRGGTAELIERSTVIRGKLDALLAERNPSQILIADAGDGIEGFESGGNPMFTNDLSLSGQLDTYGTELFEYIGLFMHKQVQKVTDAANMNVEWTKPAEYDESVSVDFYGTRIGLVHGNQFGPGQAVTWWQKQAFGAQAAASADVLVHGHYHSFSASVAGRNPVSGRQRYCLGAPTLDNGSDWFRQTQGRDSDPGLMVFDVTDNGFELSSLTILTA
jgi:hypothetical protein